MNRAKHPRGSVLMVVVGLLVIVAMLGSSLMIVSYLSSYQAENVTVRAIVPTTATGISLLLQNILAQDYHVAVSNEWAMKDTGPYGSYPKTPDSWKKYIDYPSIYVDPWLSAHGYIDPHDPEGGVFIGLPFGLSYTGIMVDTDGDTMILGGGIAEDAEVVGGVDAHLYNAEVWDAYGREYQVALRILDTSGLYNINAHGDSDADKLLSPIRPINIGLRRYLRIGWDDDSIYDALHDARSGGAGGSGQGSLLHYSEYCAEHLLNAMAYTEDGGSYNNYKPFSFGDEVYLRWRKPFSQGERGDLKPIISGVAGSTLKNLTTFSASSSIPRHPSRTEADVSGLMRQRLGDVGEPSSEMDEWSVREGLYHKFKQMIEGGLGASMDLDDADSTASQYYYFGGAWAPVPTVWQTAMDPSAHKEQYSKFTAGPLPVAMRYDLMAIDVPGTYEVSLWWPSIAEDRSANVTVTIVHQDPSTRQVSTETIMVDQTTDLGAVPGSSNWYPVGRFAFNTTFDAALDNVQQYVRIESTTNEAGTTVMADGVRLQLQPESIQAAHVVANLWAATSDADPIDEPFMFQPSTVGDWVVFGQCEQLVISEVGVYYKPESDVASGDEQWVIAVEVFNPTDEDLTVAKPDLNDNHYRIRCGDNSWSFREAFDEVGPLLGGIVEPGERAVLYSVHNGPNVAGEDELDASGLGFTEEGFYNVGDEVFAQFITADAAGVPIAKPIRIERAYTTGLIVPVDMVWTDQELGFVPPAVKGSPTGIIAMRDDHYVPVDLRI
ncbi:MAG: carbohydrate-binding protein, partial [Planctomycetota bacterium]